MNYRLTSARLQVVTAFESGWTGTGEEYARCLVSLFNKFETKTAVKVVQLSEYSDTAGIEKFPVTRI